MRSRLAVGILMLVATVGCNRRQSGNPVLVQGGDADRGRAAIGRYGCGSCHTIPGISGARGLVGPPLTGIGGREFVAGVEFTPPTTDAS